MSKRIAKVTFDWPWEARDGEIINRRVTFTLKCDSGVQITEDQMFEIVAPGCESVWGLVLPGSVVNRSDGVTLARLIGDERRHRDFVSIVERLRSMPNVTDVQVVASPK